jgi:hypothetical protein
VTPFKWIGVAFAICGPLGERAARTSIVRSPVSRTLRIGRRDRRSGWAMHILPKGYTRSRHFGGYHGRKRAEYIACCRELLAKSLPAIANLVTEPPVPPSTEPTPLQCPRCDVPMRCIAQRRRPSWKFIFARSIYDDATLYSPMHHIYSRAPPALAQDE